MGNLGTTLVIAVLVAACAALASGWLAAKLRVRELEVMERGFTEFVNSGRGGDLSLDTYQGLAMRTAKAQLPREAMSHALLGLGSEVGELMTHWKAHLYYGRALDREYMVKEMGDVLWFLQRAAAAMLVTLGEVGTKNVAKLQLRYPHKYSDEAALARADEVRS